MNQDDMQVVTLMIETYHKNVVLPLMQRLAEQAQFIKDLSSLGKETVEVMKHLAKVNNLR